MLFRHGLAESSAKEGDLGVSSGIRVTFGHRCQPALHLPVTGLRFALHILLGYSATADGR